MKFDLKNIDWKAIDPKALLGKQLNRIAMGAVVAGVVAFIIIQALDDSKKKAVKQAESKPVKIMSATDILPLEDMKYKHLDEKINEARSTAAKEIKDFAGNLEDYKKKLKEEMISEIGQQKAALLKDIDEQRAENRKMSEQIKYLKASVAEIPIPGTVVSSGGRAGAGAGTEASFGESRSIINIIEVVDNKKLGFKIPANRFASGTLEHGVDVSTAIHSGSNPIPIKITLEKPGNLPEGFMDKYEACTISGACAGTLSDERVRIRLESMTCRDKKTKEEVETELHGYLTDEGGKEGVRGIIADKSQKLLKNSFIGGMIGGLSGTGRKQATSAWPFGASLKQDSLGTKLQDGLLGGAEASSDRISKYYLDFAEKIQPIIQIEAGRRVDVHFSQTVFLGEKGMKNKIIRQRDRSRSIQQQEENND